MITNPVNLLINNFLYVMNFSAIRHVLMTSFIYLISDTPCKCVILHYFIVFQVESISSKKPIIRYQSQQQSASGGYHEESMRGEKFGSHQIRIQTSRYVNLGIYFGEQKFPEWKNNNLIRKQKALQESSIFMQILRKL